MIPLRKLNDRIDRVADEERAAPTMATITMTVMTTMFEIILFAFWAYYSYTSPAIARTSWRYYLPHYNFIVSFLYVYFCIILRHLPGLMMGRIVTVGQGTGSAVHRHIPRMDSRVGLCGGLTVRQTIYYTIIFVRFSFVLG